jgi:hypothetical protein
MTTSALIADLKKMIGPAVGVDDSGLRTWLNESYLHVVDEIIKVNPDYFSKSATTSTVANQQEYELPSDVDKVLMVNIAYDGTNWLRAKPLDNINQISVHSSGTAGFSQAEPYFYLLGDYIGFAPIPDAVGTNNIKMWYVYTPTELSADSDVPAIPSKYHHILKYGAFANYLDQDQEYVYAERMRKNFDLRVYKAVEAMNERQLDEPKFVTISDNEQTLDI